VTGSDYFADIVGLSGVSIILITYFLLQASYIKVSDLSYSLINGIGSLLIMYSLLHNWNTASVVIEIAWFCISLYGVLKAWKKKQSLKKV